MTPFGRLLFPAVTTTGDIRSVVLTFDDGPHPAATPRLLDELDAASAHATFFLVGEQVQRAPDVALEIARRGHEIACHGYVHRNHLARTPKETHDDIVRSRELIESVCGVPVSHFRPPYGVFNLSSWQTCRTVGLTPVLWSRWTRDWEERASVRSIVAGATAGLVGGEIVLLHDADTYSAPSSHDDTIAAVPEIVGYVHSMGLQAVTLGTALEARIPA